VHHVMLILVYLCRDPQGTRLTVFDRSMNCQVVWTLAGPLDHKTSFLEVVLHGRHASEHVNLRPRADGTLRYEYVSHQVRTPAELCCTPRFHLDTLTLPLVILCAQAPATATGIHMAGGASARPPGHGSSSSSQSISSGAPTSTGSSKREV
jgi:hypothetical protein